MAVSSAENTYNIFNPFSKLLSLIGTELETYDVKIIKSFLVELPSFKEEDLDDIDPREPGSGIDLISKFQKYRLIAPNNLDLLRDCLKATKSLKLLEKVDKFAETVPTLDDRELTESMAELEDLFLVLSCKKEHLSPTQIDKLRQDICNCISLKELTTSHLPYISSQENGANKNTTVARFQFPRYSTSISEIIHSSAMNKDDWLKENGVVMLKVDGLSSINIEENVEFHPQNPEHNVVLANKPGLQAVHKRNIVDVILVVAMPVTVTPHSCKVMLNECESAILALSETPMNQEDIDMNLAVVRFGNHAASNQPIAFITQDFCKDFKVSSKLKEEGQCGGGGNSGMADALAKVAELAEGDKIRGEASKVCIMISFLPKSDKTLEHYRCNHGNDVIKLTNTLAEHGIPLYILGVHDSTQRTKENLCFEERFLAGICHIGGGRHFRILKNEVNEMISGVVRSDLSIENHGEIAGEVVKDALTNHLGDVNDQQLANDVVHDARINTLHFYRLLQNGQSLQPVTQVVQRVALADDLSDAIEAMERIQCRKAEYEESAARGTLHTLNPRLLDDSFGNKDLFWKYEEKDRVMLYAGPHTAALQEHTIDVEMASRIAKRHLHRMAYYKKKP